jgi:GT2 family glycosyltransferase
MSFPLVSIIVLNFNGKKTLGKILEDCLLSVLETNYPNMELIFVDNASTDDSVAFVTKRFSSSSNLRIIRNDKNYGFAEGNNRGIREARGKYLALLNSDTKVDPDWLRELVVAAQNSQVGAVQSKLLIMNMPTQLDSAGGLIDYYGYPYEIGRLQEASRYERSREIFYAKGASILLKREVLNKTGLIDP